MTNNDFILLTTFMLEKLPFFDQGFANVYLDELTGYIYQGDGSEKFAVGIDDAFGNYFYIRTDADIRYSDSRTQLDDISKTMDETVKCYVVANVDEADPKNLVQSLLNALLLYGDQRIRAIRAIYHRETALQKELSRLDDETALHALQHLDERQIVILEFDFTTKFSPVDPSCLPSPCKSCTDE